MVDINSEKLLDDAAALDEFNRNFVAEFRENGGRVGGPFAGRTMLLLHTVGAKSGQPRLSPLAYLDVDGKMVIVGSYAGAPKHPGWVHNLRADPRARVEVGAETVDVVARELPEDERAALYPRIVEWAPALSDYHSRTTRTFPLFELVRAEVDAEDLLNDRSALDAMNNRVVEEFRANGGQVGGDFAGMPLVLLTTIGAKSGQPRVSPLAYFDIDGRILIAGSMGGAPTSPAWVHNLRAQPGAHVEIGTEAYDAEVRELPRDERDALYPRVVEQAPQFGEYQAKTTRVIPLFEIVRS